MTRMPPAGALNWSDRALAHVVADDAESGFRDALIGQSIRPAPGVGTAIHETKLDFLRPIRPRNAILVERSSPGRQPIVASRR